MHMLKTAFRITLHDAGCERNDGDMFAGLLFPLANDGGGFEAVHSRHLNVHEHNA